VTNTLGKAGTSMNSLSPALFAHSERPFKSELFPLSEVRFFVKTADLELTFVKDDKGQVTQLEIPDNGQKLVAKRIN
jgi:hypothetical protein